jgi:hypothetical protein
MNQLVKNLQDQTDAPLIDPRQYKGKTVTGATAGVTGEVADAAAGILVASLEVPAGDVLAITELYLSANNIALSGANFILSNSAANTLAGGIAGTRLGVFGVGDVIATVKNKHIKLDTPIIIDNSAGTASIWAVLYTGTFFAGVARAATEFVSGTIIGILE